jgi:transposase
MERPAPIRGVVDYAAGRTKDRSAELQAKEPVDEEQTTIRRVGCTRRQHHGGGGGGGGEARSLGTIPNTAEALRKLIARLGPSERLRICYEAGLCGFVLYWQLHEIGVYCAVIAPSLIPQRSGERVKTDGLLIKVRMDDGASCRFGTLTQERDEMKGVCICNELGGKPERFWWEVRRAY